MRKLNTIEYAALLAATVPNVAVAQSASATSDRLTNADITELSLSEQKYWVHGAISGLAHGLIHNGNEQGHCIWEWYFGADQSRLPTIQAAFRKYPTADPSSTIIAITDRACPARR